MYQIANRANGNSHFDIAEFPLPTENIPKPPYHFQVLCHLWLVMYRQHSACKW